MMDENQFGPNINTTPVAIFLAPTSVPQSDQRDEAANSHHICRGLQPPAPSSCPPPPPDPAPPPAVKVAPKQEGVGVWPIVPTPPRWPHLGQRGKGALLSPKKIQHDHKYAN